MVFADGKISAEGSQGKRLTFEEVAAAAYEPRRLPEGMEASLYEYCALLPPRASSHSGRTWPWWKWPERQGA